jgi:hypothetical protein
MTPEKALQMLLQLAQSSGRIPQGNLIELRNIITKALDAPNSSSQLKTLKLERDEAAMRVLELEEENMYLKVQLEENTKTKGKKKNVT